MSKVYLQTPFPYSTENVYTVSVKEFGKRRAQCISVWYIYELRFGFLVSIFGTYTFSIYMPQT